MGSNNNGTFVTSNLTITIPVGAISPSFRTETVSGFLLSGSLTTDDGIGDNIGIIGTNLNSGPFGVTSPTDGTILNVPVANGTNGGNPTQLGNGTGMKVNITVTGGIVTLVAIVDGGSGYAIGDKLFITNTTLVSFGLILVTSNDFNLQTLTAADLTGGGTPYMLNFNPSPISSSFDTVPETQRLFIGGPQLALYHAYNTTVSQSLFNTNLLQTSNNNLGAGTLLWTTSGSDPANSNNYMTWTPDGSDAPSYQDSNTPFLLERGDIIRVEAIKNLNDVTTNSSRSVNIIEDFTVEKVIPYYYTSSFTNEPNFNALATTIGPYEPLNPSENLGFSVQAFPAVGNGQNSENAPTTMVTFTENVGRVNAVTKLVNGNANFTAGNTYPQTSTTGNGTGAELLVVTATGGNPNIVQIVDDPDKKGLGFVALDQITFGDGVGIGLVVRVDSLLDTNNSVIGNGTKGRVEIQSITTYIPPGSGTYTPGWNKIILSEGQGFKAGDQIQIDGDTFLEPNQWAVPANANITANSAGELTITLTSEMLTNTNFNNDFTIGVDTNAQYSYDSTTTPPNTNVPSGSVAGYHLYEKGEVGFTANTFVQVSPDPEITLNGLKNGEVTKFTVRRQIEADDKVMLKNIIPPSGSLGVATPSGQGFLIPNDFTSVQKANALNIINQLKAKNAFDKPLEPGISKD